MDDTLRLLTRAGPIIRQGMLDSGFRIDSCISATRIGLDFLTRAGLDDAYGLVVQVAIYNQELMDHAKRVGRLPLSGDETESWNAEDGSWALGLGFPNTPDGAQADTRARRFPGHMVVIVNRRILWDISIDQANRPARHIEFTDPVLLPVTEPFLRGREPVAATWSASGRELSMVYYARPADKTFRTAPAWTEPLDYVLAGVPR